MPMTNLKGKRVGLLKVIRCIGKNKFRIYFWRCECACGKFTTVSTASLKSKTTRSCGCLAKQLLTNRNKQNKTHGYSKRSEYTSWIEMRRRCYNTKRHNYSEYGGRGIKVCRRWKTSFENFLADMGDKPNKNYSIDRIDVNKNYTEENCKWSDSLEQCHNRRCSNSYIW